MACTVCFSQGSVGWLHFILSRLFAKVDIEKVYHILAFSYRCSLACCERKF